MLLYVWKISANVYKILTFIEWILLPVVIKFLTKYNLRKSINRQGVKIVIFFPLVKKYAILCFLKIMHFRPYMVSLGMQVEKERKYSLNTPDVRKSGGPKFAEKSTKRNKVVFTLFALRILF